MAPGAGRKKTAQTSPRWRQGAVPLRYSQIPCKKQNLWQAGCVRRRAAAYLTMKSKQRPAKAARPGFQPGRLKKSHARIFKNPGFFSGCLIITRPPRRRAGKSRIPLLFYIGGGEVSRRRTESAEKSGQARRQRRARPKRKESGARPAFRHGKALRREDFSATLLQKGARGFAAPKTEREEQKKTGRGFGAGRKPLSLGVG